MVLEKYDKFSNRNLYTLKSEIKNFEENYYSIIDNSKMLHEIAPEYYNKNGRIIYNDSNVEQLKISFNDGKYLNFIPSQEEHLNILKTIKDMPYFKDKSPLLCDIGCGLGTVLYAANKLGYKTIGVDINENLKKFHDRISLNVKYGDILDINLDFLKDVDVIYLYKPINDSDLNKKLLERIFNNTKKEIIIIFYYPPLEISRKFQTIKKIMMSGSILMKKKFYI